MPRAVLSVFGTLLILLITLPAFSDSQENPAAIPAPRQVEFEWMSLDTWHKRHQTNVDRAKQGKAELLFLGDSITEGWTWGDNQTIFDKTFGKYTTANFGIGGDQTQNLLWRLQNGSVGKLQPKLVVLMIGTNNFGHSNHTPEQVAGGVRAVIDEITRAFPDARILLMGVLPYGHEATSDSRVRVAKTNTLLASFNDDNTLFYYDFGSLYLDDRGRIPAERMADFLHPTHQGYQMLADHLGPVVDQLLEGKTP